MKLLRVALSGQQVSRAGGRLCSRGPSSVPSAHVPQQALAQFGARGECVVITGLTPAFCLELGVDVGNRRVSTGRAGSWASASASASTITMNCSRCSLPGGGGQLPGWPGAWFLQTEAGHEFLRKGKAIRMFLLFVLSKDPL